MGGLAVGVGVGLVLVAVEGVGIEGDDDLVERLVW